MFDFGFGELMVIAVIALVVLGPKRLPVAARLAGLWIRKARTQWNAVKAELENEMADDDLRKSLREASDAMHEGAQQLRGAHEEMTAIVRPTTRRPGRTRPPAELQQDSQPAGAIDATPIEQSISPPAPIDVAQPDPAQLSLLDQQALPKPQPPVDADGRHPDV